MNKNILNIDAQSFIRNNLNNDIISILLKKSIIKNVSSKELVEQIEAKKKCQQKLPTWYNTENIYFPNKLNIEQTSSEITAKYKSEITASKSLIDLTGGFGIDSYFFSQKTTNIVHCEINKTLSEIATHNFNTLGTNNIQTENQDGIAFLKESNTHFDWIFIDPSRRNTKKGKVILLEDYSPNVTAHIDLLLGKADRILIKTAPLLDISAGISALKHVCEIHIVAINNEVKELLWVLKNDFKGDIPIKTINISKRTKEIFTFKLFEEKKSIAKLSLPETYIYEPNVAILKSGGFNIISKELHLNKLNKHTHLYTSKQLIEFPGRRFKILNTYRYNKKNIKKLGIKYANITIRNFPETVATIRKKTGIKDGGSIFLFFFKNINEKHDFIVCTKI